MAKNSIKTWICVSEDGTTIFGDGTTPNRARFEAENYLKQCGSENELPRCTTVYAKIYVEHEDCIEGNSSWKHLGVED